LEMVFEKALEHDKPCAIIANLVVNFMNLHQNVIVEPILVHHVHKLLVNWVGNFSHDRIPFYEIIERFRIAALLFDAWRYIP
jgi:hypothetical protein